MYTVSRKGENHIKQWEELKLKAYVPPEGLKKDGTGWTIGYGSTYIPKGLLIGINGETMAFSEDRLITSDMVLNSEDDADLLLRHLLKERYGKCVNENVNVQLKQNHFDALVSFCFNVGENDFKRSLLLKKLNAKDYAGAVAQFCRWNKHWDPKQGKLDHSEGLINRRVSEMELYLSDYNDTIFKERFSWFSNFFKG